MIVSDYRRIIRQSCRVLGFRRQTYHARKNGHRLEQTDDVLADLLHQITQRFVAWGFWKVNHYLRNLGHPINHKRVYRIISTEGK